MVTLLFPILIVWEPAIVIPSFARIGPEKVVFIEVVPIAVKLDRSIGISSETRYLKLGAASTPLDGPE